MRAKAKVLTQVERDYEAGKWVPCYYGLRFSVAKKDRKPFEIDHKAFKVKTFTEAQAECNKRNA